MDGSRYRAFAIVNLCKYKLIYVKIFIEIGTILIYIRIIEEHAKMFKAGSNGF